MMESAITDVISMTRPVQLQALAKMSADLGREFCLVQGPGGNSSLKEGDTLWVKASGSWLAEALDKPIFVSLSLAKVVALLAAGQGDDFASAIQSNTMLKASIETGLHALMPHPVVIHTHSFGSVLTSTLRRGYDRLQERLGDHIQWDWIPYRRPGGPLAVAVAQCLAARHRLPDVLLLANHGVVVGADTAEDAAAILRDVERRLEFPVQERLASRTMSGSMSSTGRTFDLDQAYTRLASDATALRFLTEAPRFPDQVVFVGGALPLVRAGESVEEASKRAQERFGIQPVAVIERHVGVHLRRDRTSASDATIRALLDIALRLPEHETFDGLSESAIEVLANWDAEAYRQKLDNSR
ncbi:class II aldolase/adducin family protein [Methylobacterium longum]|uniref:Class II aldolase/adducin family protein n=1 Tax=Methylobacterium longum TaxID=767694 RepID=A0ABT8AXM2_9HYPH|nr:class II aldolase/adducin family protein [Methylobacterium longum]MDN3574563.1 class II aldolase/adducin family protein [Methylobacterium longum]